VHGLVIRQRCASRVQFVVALNRYNTIFFANMPGRDRADHKSAMLADLKRFGFRKGTLTVVRDFSHHDSH
jgi:hypothetical protein